MGKILTAVISSALVLGLMGTSCKKDNNQLLGNERSVKAGGPSGNPGDCGTETVSGVITTNTTWQSCKIYKLSGLVYVTNGATLTIEEGTRIEGIKSTTVGTPGGGLIVTRGSKLIANGSAVNPIVFTSAEMVKQSGDWSGIVLLGKAPTNWVDARVVEGIPNVPPNVDATYGGSANQDPADNSGSLQYVRIEYAGFELATDNELNGLTLAGVGNGTTLSHIEVYKSNDDAFEFFGGTVNADHLLSIDALDDMFDTDNGYTGTISYALGVSDPTRADKSQSNGFESDNNADGTVGIGLYNSLITHPTYNYITIVGQKSKSIVDNKSQPPSGRGVYGRAAHLRRNAEFSINNSIFLGYNYGISLDTQKPDGSVNTLTKYNSGISTLTNNYVSAFVESFSTEVNFASFGSYTPTAGNKGYVSNPTNANSAIKLTDPFASPRTLGGYKPDAGAASPATSAGAFAGSANWGSTTSWIIF